MVETTTSMAIPTTPVSQFLSAVGVQGSKKRRRRKPDDSDGKLQESQDIEKFSASCQSACSRVVKKLKKFRLGVTAKKVMECSEALGRVDEFRSDYPSLLNAEHVLLSTLLRLIDWTDQLTVVLDKKDYHDFCQEVQKTYESLAGKLNELAGEYRRAGKQKLDNPSSMELQSRKYLNHIRDWADSTVSRTASAVDRFI